MGDADIFPSAAMAEINRIQYELDYTEGISQQMRIPEKLKIGSGSSEDPPGPLLDASHCTMMLVPERIVVAGNEDDNHFGRPRDLDLIQSTPLDTFELKTPPRVLTLNDQALDLQEAQTAANVTGQPKMEMRSPYRLRREHCRSENSTMRRNGQLNRNYSGTPSPSQAPIRVCPPLVSPEDAPILNSASGVLSYIRNSTRRAYQQVLEVLDDSHSSQTVFIAVDAGIENPSDDSHATDGASLRRQLIKLNRRLQLLEQGNKERGKRETLMYSLTVAFWLINTWIWLRR
ncbi:hypothetical protein DNTS_006981 [Danionella cerebrum]|uniref:Mitochondrial fission factor n=1 Tax=Danionella cerebrum TaxID=2873325 RepID=A0A553NRX1_9TELE|nr:hypothetical protein DNTS_006981 [Danionella translucida]